MAYDDDDYDYGGDAEGVEPSYQQPAEDTYSDAGMQSFQQYPAEDTSIPENARYTSGNLPTMSLDEIRRLGGQPEEAPSGGGQLPTMSLDEIQRLGGKPDSGNLPTMSLDEIQRLGGKPESAESPLMTGAREAAHGVLPTLAAIGTGAATGALGGAWGGPLGMVGGALLGGGLAAYGVSEAQEAALKALGVSDEAQRAANIKENPWSAAIGGAAPGVLGLRPGAGVQAVNRLVSAGLNVAPEAAQQIVTGQYHPESLITSAVAGAALPGMRGWAQDLEQDAAKLAQRMGAPMRMGPPGRPDMQPNPQPGTQEAEATVKQGTPGSEAAAGTSEIEVPPSDVSVSGREIGEGSARDYPAEPRPGTREAQTAIDQQAATAGEASPEIKAALDALAEDAAPARAPPPENIPTDPAALRELAAGMRRGGLEGRAREFERAADTIESRGAAAPRAAEQQFQQAQQTQPPAAGGQPPGGPPPGGGLTPTGGQPPLPPRYTSEQARAKVRERIGEQPKEPLLSKDRLHDLYTWIKDKFHHVERIEREVTGKVDEAGGPYQQLRMTASAGRTAQADLQNGVFDRSGNKIAEGLHKTLNDNIKTQDDYNKLEEYMISKQAIDDFARTKKTGVDIDAARKVVQDLETQLRPVAEELYKFGRAGLQGLVDDGLLSNDAMLRMVNANAHHAPLKRVMDAAPGGTGGSLLKPVQAKHGSERQILGPIKSMVENHMHYAELRAENRARQAMENFANNHPNAFLFEKQRPSIRPIQVTSAELNRYLTDQGIPHTVSDAMDIFRPNAFRQGTDNFVVMNNGKATAYKVDPRLAQAYNNIGPQEIHWLFKILAAPARTLRAGATTAPEFSFRNVFRDQLTAMAFSKNGYVPFWDAARGLLQVVTKGEQFKLLERKGAFQAALVDIDRNYMQMNIDALERSTGQKIINVLKSPLEGLRKLSETLENATRMGEGMRALGKGLSPEEAAWHARNLMDYSQMGSQMKAVQSIVPFMGSHLVGLDRAARAFKENPSKFLTMMGTAITLPSVALWAANKDDPRYKEMPRWKKDLTWPIFTNNWVNISAAEANKMPDKWYRQGPNGQWQRNDGAIFHLPKPFELGMLFGTIPERLLDYVYNNNPNAFKELPKSLAGTFFPSIVPQALVPIGEQFANYSQFLNRPLVSKSLEGIKPEYQATPSTSETAKLVGQGMAWLNEHTGGFLPKGLASPIVLENYFRQYTGGLGKYATDIADIGLRATGAVQPGAVAPAKTVADYPIARAFMSRVPTSQAESIKDFYDKYEERKEAKMTEKYLRKEGRGEDARTIRQNEALETAEHIKRQMSDVTKRNHNIYNDTKMTAEQKRAAIDSNNYYMMKLAQQGLRRFEQNRKAEVTPWRYKFIR